MQSPRRGGDNHKRKGENTQRTLQARRVPRFPGEFEQQGGGMMNQKQNTRNLKAYQFSPPASKTVVTSGQRKKRFAQTEKKRGRELSNEAMPACVDAGCVDVHVHVRGEVCGWV